MADEVDLANELVEQEMARRLRELNKQAVPENDTGSCWFCGEAVPDNRRWCSAECRDLDPRSK